MNNPLYLQPDFSFSTLPRNPCKTAAKPCETFGGSGRFRRVLSAFRGNAECLEIAHKIRAFGLFQWGFVSFAAGLAIKLRQPLPPLAKPGNQARSHAKGRAWFAPAYRNDFPHNAQDKAPGFRFSAVFSRVIAAISRKRGQLSRLAVLCPSAVGTGKTHSFAEIPASGAGRTKQPSPLGYRFPAHN